MSQCRSPAGACLLPSGPGFWAATLFSEPLCSVSRSGHHKGGQEGQVGCGHSRGPHWVACSFWGFSDLILICLLDFRLPWGILSCDRKCPQGPGSPHS